MPGVKVSSAAWREDLGGERSRERVSIYLHVTRKAAVLKQFVSQDVQANNSRRAFERQEYSQNTMTPFGRSDWRFG